MTGTVALIKPDKRLCRTRIFNFADIFKPIIVDRIIFTLINRGQLSKDDFRHCDDGSVLLTDSGKRLFLEAFEEKMYSKLSVKDKEISFNQLIQSEIRLYQQHIQKDDIYKPYKYY